MRLVKVLVPLAGLAVFSMPAMTSPTGTECAGGVCAVCPAVAKVLSTAGAQIYCIA